MKIDKFLSIRGLPQLGLVFFFLNMQFWFPIWVLFLLERGLTLTEIIIADMIFYGAIILFEVPVGMIGDRLGRKKTYFLAAVLGTISYLLMILIYDFFFLVICWVTWSAYISVQSGTDTAYIYEILKSENELENSTYVFGYFSAIASLSFIITHFLAGFLYEIDSNLPIFLNVIFSFLAAVIVLTLPNPYSEYSKPTFQEILKAMKDSFLTNKVVRNSIFVISILMMYHWTLTLIFQPLLLDLGLEVEFFGFMYFTFTLLGIVSSLLSGPVDRRIGKLPVVVTSIFLIVIAVGITGFIPGILSVIGIIWLRFAFYLSEPVLKVTLNSEIEDTHRASIFSFTNMLYSLMLVFSRPLVGFITDLWDTKFAFQIWFLFGIPLMLISLLLVRDIFRKKEK